MTLKPIRELITSKPRPDLTPSLVPAFQGHAAEMVETYIFTNTIRGYFEEIFDNVARGHGQGFWIEAEYGAGKTHFLVTLAALLSNGSNELWTRVHDEAIRHTRQRLATTRLFPVVLSLRGEGASDPYIGRSLLNVILEEGFLPALATAGLDGQIHITAAEDLLAWLDMKASPAIRNDVAEFVHSRTSQSLEAYRNNEGIDALADIMRDYFETTSIKPDVPTGVKERLAHIYRQLTDRRGPNYTGLLVVIDEYEGWQRNHNSPEELSRDAELLETLGFLLPRDLGYQVYTVVASQSGVPTKLHGSQQGDRFIRMPLLAQTNARDYDMIISSRTRSINKETYLPDIKDYYDEYVNHFHFVRGLSEAEFCDIFPFQPRCFEAVRRITARDLPTARSGLLVFWEVVNSQALVEQATLIRLADMVQSHHLIEDCLTKSVYKEAYTAYRVALESLSHIELDDEDLPLARDVLTTLFLWFVAFLEQPLRMSLRDLAEATLTKDGLLRPEDNVAYVLDSMRALRQIEFDGKTARFVPAGGDETISILGNFNEHKRRALRDSYRLQAAWAESLFWTPRETGGATGIFNKFTLDVYATQRIESRNLQYTGQVMIASPGRLDYGLALPTEDLHFRLILLIADSASVKSEALQDSRIAVVLPGEMTEEVREAAAAYLAWCSMAEEWKNETGREAEEVRSWLESQKQSIFNALAATQLKLYQAGRIVTRDNLGISLRDAFGQGGDIDRRIAAIVDPLLTTAYRELPLDSSLLRGALTPTEVGKVFEGYFNKQPRLTDSAATKSYGVGLRLSHPDNPQRFAPQNPRVFALIEEALVARGGGDLPVWQLYDRLARPPFGLPYVVIQLYLLAFVRRADPRVDLLLKPHHSLRLRDGQPVTRERLTASTVSDLEWKPGLEDKFDALVPAVGPSWNDVLAYAREITPDLRVSSDQADIERQSHRLQEALQALKQEVENQQRTLTGVLAPTLAASVPSAVTEDWQKLARLAAVDTKGYHDFYEQAETIFDRNPDALRISMQMLVRLRELVNVTPQVIQMKRYLDEMTLRPTDAALAAERHALLRQMALVGLMERPESWHAVYANFKRFMRRYCNEYQKHHRDYYTSVDRLHASLNNAQARLTALKLLNSIESIGVPVGRQLEARFQELEQGLLLCSVRQVTAVTVDAKPTCDECDLALTAIPPETAVNDLLSELDEALALKQKQLASETVTKVLRKADDPAMKPLLDAARAPDSTALVYALNADLTALANRLLEEEEVYTIEAEILTGLAQRYPSIEEDDIPHIVAEFESSLRAAFARARQTGKKIFRLNLR